MIKFKKKKRKKQRKQEEGHKARRRTDSPLVSDAPLTLNPHRAPTHRRTAGAKKKRLTDERLSFRLLP